MEILCSHRLSCKIICHNDPSQTFLQIVHICGQAEDGHDLRGNGDHEMILPDNAVGLGSQSDHDISQSAVVHVQAPLPEDLPGVDAQGVPLLDMVIQKSG